MHAGQDYSSFQVRDPDILIVEDEHVSRRALAALLSTCGYSAVAVGSAEDAVRLLRRGTCPGIALVDVDLPGMSGLELIELMERERPGVFSILLTAAEFERIREFRDEHPVAYLPKPVDFDRLLSLIGQHQISQ